MATIPTLLTIAGILYLALQLEDKLKIPSPLGLEKPEQI